jgi:hypothetical protein
LEEAFVAVDEHESHLCPVFSSSLIVFSKALGAPAVPPTQWVTYSVEGLVSGLVDFDGLSFVSSTTQIQVLVCFQHTTDGSELELSDGARALLSQRDLTVDAFDDFVALGYLAHGGVGKLRPEDVAASSIRSLSLVEVEGLSLAVGVADIFTHHGLSCAWILRSSAFSRID